MYIHKVTIHHCQEQLEANIILKEREYKYSLRQHADFSKFYLWTSVWRNGLKFFLGKHSLSNIIIKLAADQSIYLQPPI